MWDLIVSVPDHCLSFYFSRKASALSKSGCYGNNKGFEHTNSKISAS